MVSIVQELFGIDDPSSLSITQLRIMSILKEKGPMTRDEICEEFGFETYECNYIQKYTRTGTTTNYHKKITLHHKRTTIHDNLKVLIKRKIVEKFSRNNGKRGRPKVYFKLKS